jgi:hypothetical protein
VTSKGTNQEEELMANALHEALAGRVPMSYWSREMPVPWTILTNKTEFHACLL